MAGSRGAAWIAATLLLALLLLAASTLAAAGRLEARAGSLVGGLADAVDSAVRPFSEFLLSAGELRALSDENARLKGEVARLSSEVAALREERTASLQVDELLSAVETAGLLAGGAAAGGAAPRVVNASVLARDPSPTRAELLIDRGRAHGVYVGQPVLGPAATLVGIVSGADERSARIRLLIDVRSAVTSVVQGSRTPAALAGTADGLRLEFVPAGAPVAVGDTVITSALGGRLPAGLLAGRIATISEAPHDLFATIEVEPLVDYNRLEQILVLTGALPGEPTAEAPR